MTWPLVVGICFPHAVFPAPKHIRVRWYKNIKPYLHSLGSRHSPLPQPIHSAGKKNIDRDHLFNHGPWFVVQHVDCQRCYDQGGWKELFLTYEYHILIQSILHNNCTPIPSYNYRAHSPVGVYKRHSLFPPSLPHMHKNLEPYRFREHTFDYHGCKWARCKGCFLLPRGLKTASNQIDKSRCLCSHKYNLLSSEMIWEFSWGTNFVELWV